MVGGTDMEEEKKGEEERRMPMPIAGHHEIHGG
jgi:hypothetical protein